MAPVRLTGSLFFLVCCALGRRQTGVHTEVGREYELSDPRDPRWQNDHGENELAHCRPVNLLVSVEVVLKHI